MYYTNDDTPKGTVLESLLQLLFPMGTYCICCGKYVDISRPYLICDTCMEAINWGFITIDLEEERKHSGRTFYLDSALSCMVYSLHSKRLVFDLKYNKKTYLARPISMIMEDRLRNDETLYGFIESLDYVVPVPLHSERLKKRGFNQAALISENLARRLAKAINSSSPRYLPCLKRNKQTIEQRSVTGGQRFTNLEGAFSLDPRYESDLKGSRILLIDDIFTTGATADRCARILKDAGASEVHLLSLTTGNYYLKGSFRPRGDEDFLSSIYTSP